jgi:hypothetical protein
METTTTYTTCSPAAVTVPVIARGHFAPAGANAGLADTATLAWRCAG